MPGDPAVRRATRLVAVVLCLLAVAEAGYGASDGGAGEALMVVAMVVLPLLYVLPATRPLWLRHRYPRHCPGPPAPTHTQTAIGKACRSAEPERRR